MIFDRGTKRKLQEKEREVARLRERLAAKDERIARLRKRSGDLADPSSVVWVFGAGRTGSTWLAAMMGDLPGHAVWFEPQVGQRPKTA